MKKSPRINWKKSVLLLTNQLVLICVLIMPSSIYANTTSTEQVQRFAYTFLKTSSNLMNSKIKKAPLDINAVQLQYVSDNKASVPVYVYQTMQQGFVVIAECSTGFQVVGYSDKATFDPQNIPTNLSRLLTLYENADPQKMVGFNSDNKATVIVEPLLDKAGVSLDQFHHENVGGSWSGCVATAMTQILCYYKYPSKGIGSHCYTHSKYGEQCADFGATTYNWTNPTDDDYKKLSFHVGVAMDMNYSVIGSSPLAQDWIYTLDKYFGCFTEVIPSDNEYILEALNLLKPIYASIPGIPDGHAIVIDGYDSNNYLHINFGWGGTANGYYLMNTNTTFNVGYTFGTNISVAAVVSNKPVYLNNTDSLALVSLKNNIGGINWDLSNYRNREGIATLNGNVIELGIYSANSAKNEGAIPDDIGNLSSLRRLSISGKLHGTFPQSISKLTKLNFLSIANYSGTLSDTLPQNIGNLTNLQYVSFFGCAKGAIPASIGKLAQLKSLDVISGNIDKALPNELCNLSSLQSLNLQENKIPGTLPPNIGNLKELLSLNLSDNLLSGALPTSLGTLNKIGILDFSKNNLNGVIPSDLEKCTSLTKLVLNNNNLEGAVPPIFGKLSKMSTLELSNNKLSALPENIGSLSNLTSLNLNNNLLIALPDSLNELVNLEMLTANNNKISKLPTNMNKFSKLRSLDLSYNEITDFHEDLCFYPYLPVISLNNNKIKKLPLMIADLSAVQLQLQNNELSGSIPPQLLRTQISYYKFENNYFTYNDLPKGSDFVNKIGYQKPIQISKNIFKGNFGDTIAIDIRKVCTTLNKNDKFLWCEHPQIKKQYQTQIEVEQGPVLHIVLNDRNLSRKFYCQITNDSSALYINPDIWYKLPCLPALFTDTVSLGVMTDEEYLNDKYHDNYIVASKNILSKVLSDKSVTLISPFKIRGLKVWETSADGKTWHELSGTMIQNDLKANIVSVKPEELKISPITPAFYRCALHEENCMIRYSDTLKINPYGKVICDTTLNVTNKTVTVQRDSIEVTIPQGITSGDFRLTIVKLDNPPQKPDSALYLGSVYDVNVSFGNTFYLPITIRFKNIDKKKFNINTIDNCNAVYYDDMQQKWVKYENAHINIKDTTLSFGTYHLTKLAWFELAHTTYTHIFTTKNVNVIYKYGNEYLESTWYYEYHKKVNKGDTLAWNFKNTDPDKNGTPYMIQDIANYTEQIIQKFKTLGIETPDLRFNVYVSVINAGAAGKVDAGTYLAGRGYLYIDPYMITIDKELDKNRETMRMALAHEYMHFTQDYYMTVLINNYFWAEATAPLADRLVWNEIEQVHPEPETLLSEAFFTKVNEKSIFDILCQSWYMDSNIPIISKIFADAKNINLASLFLHYIRSYSEPTKLDVGALLKETPYIETWLNYLNSFLTNHLHSTVGDEFADYIQYLFRGENKNFTLINQNKGHPLSYVIKNMEAGGEFAKNINYNFTNFIPQKDKITLDIPYLATKMFMLNNMSGDKATVVHYKRLTDLDKNERTYYGKYNKETKQMDIVEITDSMEYTFFLEARTDKSLNDYLNSGFLLFVNTRIPSLIEFSNNYSAQFELTATSIPNFTSLNYADVTQDAIHNYSDGSKNMFFIQGRADYNVTGATFTVDNFVTSTEMIEDSIVQIKSSFTENFKLPNGAGLPATIRKSNKNQTIEYDIITGKLKLEQNCVENNIWGEYYHDSSKITHPEYTYEMNEIEQLLQLKNVKEFTSKNATPSLNNEVYFTTQNTQETIAAVDKIQQRIRTKSYSEDGKLTSDKTVDYLNTTFTANNKMNVIFNVK